MSVFKFRHTFIQINWLVLFTLKLNLGNVTHLPDECALARSHTWAVMAEIDFFFIALTTHIERIRIHSICTQKNGKICNTLNVKPHDRGGAAPAPTAKLIMYEFGFSMEMCKQSETQPHTRIGQWVSLFRLIKMTRNEFIKYVLCVCVVCWCPFSFRRVRIFFFFSRFCYFEPI